MKIEAEIEVVVNGAEGISTVFDPLIEISADCYVCQKTTRTFELRYGDDYAVCVKDGHRLPGKIAEMITGENRVKYLIELDYNEFVEKRFKLASKRMVTWARVHFKIACPKCNAVAEGFTQNNVVRPRKLRCSCGELLHAEDEEMPIIRNSCDS